METLARTASPLETLRADHRNVEKLLRVFEAELAPVGAGLALR